MMTRVFLKFPLSNAGKSEDDALSAVAQHVEWSTETSGQHHIRGLVASPLLHGFPSTPH
jgi:hypothetical protein